MSTKSPSNTEVFDMVNNAIEIKKAITSIALILDEALDKKNHKISSPEETVSNVYFINRKFEVEYDQFVTKDIFQKDVSLVIVKHLKWAKELETILKQNKDLLIRSKLMRDMFLEQLTKLSLIMYLVDEIEDALMTFESKDAINQDL